MTPSIERPVALITGASSGFGMLTAVRLAKAGYHVVATMRNVAAKTRLIQAAESVQVIEHISIEPLDVTQAETIASTVNRVIDRFGRVDVLVNNAGYAVGGFVEEVPLDTWRAQFETNVFGLIAVTQAVLPSMRERRAGTIINVSSISGRIGFPAMGPYAASKHAVEGLTETLRLELAPYGIRVVLIEPASFRTDIWQKGLDGVSDLTESAYRRVGEKLMAGVRQIARTGGDPEQVAALIERILREDKPRLRYPIGPGAKTLDRLKRWLPWSWIERTMSRRLSK